MDGGHRFGVTGEYFKRTADFDNMFEQGAGTSYLYGENSVRKETERQRVSLDYSYRAPSDGGLLDTVTAALYWQRVSLDTRQTAVRSVDPRAFIIPRDPFRYGFPSGPYGRDNSIRQTMYGVNAEATKRLGGAVTQLWTLGGEWYGNKTEQQSSGYDNCPVIRPGTPAPFGPRACDMLHTNQADVPQSKGSQWAMWVQDEFGFADGRYTLTPALRYDHYKQKPESTDSYASNPNAGKLPSANSAGRFSPAAGRLEGGRRTQPVRAIRLWLQGAQPVPALHQLRRRRHLSARGQSRPETRNQQGLGTGRQAGLR